MHKSENLDPFPASDENFMIGVTETADYLFQFLANL